MDTYDVTIIGGGIIGCAIARELMRYDLRVILVEKECEVGFGTSKSNSGIIHAGHHSSPSTVKGSLEWAGNQKWDALHKELDFGFSRIGELTIAFDDDQMDKLHKLKKQGEDKGVTGLELWGPERIRQEEPALTEEVIGALYAPTAGVINPYEACFALIENAILNGLEISVESPVTALETAEDETWTVTTPGRRIHTRFVLNVAGVYADRIAAMAGVQTFSIQARKGEEYLLDKRLKGLVKRIIFPCPTPVSKGILVIPTVDGTLMVGPTAHVVEDKEDLTTSTAGADEVFASVKRTVPGIGERDCIAEFAGLRAAADGEDFIIGATARKGFINAAGIQSPGLTAAPAIAEMMVDILRDEGLDLIPRGSFEPSSPDRVLIANMSMDELIRLGKEDPRYGRVVCRCELVSEREVLDAIDRGARTLDGIKFRTRAGMGRCQGGFCSARCMELLSRELQMPMVAITKRGGDSWIVLERDQGGNE